LVEARGKKKSKILGFRTDNTTFLLSNAHYHLYVHPFKWAPSPCKWPARARLLASGPIFVTQLGCRLASGHTDTLGARVKSRLHYPNAKAGIHVPAFLRREKTRLGRPPARVHLVFYTKKGPPEGLTRRDVLSAIDQLAPSTRHPTTTMRRHTPRSMCTPLKRHIIAKYSCSLKAPRNKNAKEKK